MKRIEVMYAFISHDDEGEGVTAFYDHRQGWLPMVAADEARLDSLRDRASKPSLALERYAGAYRDDWYGDATISVENGHLVLRFSRSAAFVGELEHWQYDTFRARWRTRNIPDAFVDFALHPDGTIKQFTMAAVSPLADFSFDYQDLTFTPLRP